MLVKGSSLDRTLDEPQQQPSVPVNSPSRPAANLPQLDSKLSGSEGRLPVMKCDVTKGKRKQLRRAETIECIVVRDDGQRMPADIDICNTTLTKSRQKILDTIAAQVELQAEAKRNELRALILEHQKLVNDIQRMELFKLGSSLKV